MWQQNLVSGAAKVTQHVISLVVQQDVFNLVKGADGDFKLFYLNQKKQNKKPMQVKHCKVAN